MKHLVFLFTLLVSFSVHSTEYWKHQTGKLYEHNWNNQLYSWSNHPVYHPVHYRDDHDCDGHVPFNPPVLPPILPPVVQKPVTFNFNKPFSTPLSSCVKSTPNTANYVLESSQFKSVKAPKVKAYFYKGGKVTKDSFGQFVRVPTGIQLLEPLHLKAVESGLGMFDVVVNKNAPNKVYRFTHYSNGWEMAYSRVNTDKLGKKYRLQRTFAIAPVRPGLELRYYSYYRNGVYMFSKLQVHTVKLDNQKLTRGYWFDCK